MKPKGLLGAQYLLPIGALLVFVLIGFALRSVLLTLGVAFVLAYMLNPPVNYLQALRMKRSVAALVVLATFMSLTLFAIFAGLPGLVREVLEASAEASTRIPAQLESLKQTASTFLFDRFHVRIPVSIGEIGGKFSTELRNLIPNPSDIAGAFSQTMAILAAALGSLIVPLFAYYLLVDFNVIVRGLRKLIPRRIAPPVESLAIEIDAVLSQYVRGQAVKSFILAALYAIGFRLVDIRLAIPLGVMTGILAFVPYVGVLVGTALAVLMALLDWQSANHLIGVLAVVAIIILIDTFYITPKVIGDRAPLKPLEVLLAMIGSVTLVGMVGILFAVPIGAVTKILLRRIGNSYVDSRFYQYIPGIEPEVETTNTAAEPATIPPTAQSATDMPPKQSLFGRFTSIFRA